jgi:hypothetical protein
MAIISDWIEPGTTVISDWWGGYRNLKSQGYTHQTVNHSIHFVHPKTGEHTNTIESTWNKVKVFLGQYTRGDDYHLHLGHYLFMARCRAQGVPPHTIPASRRQHRLVQLESVSLNCPRHVLHIHAFPHTGTNPPHCHLSLNARFSVTSDRLGWFRLFKKKPTPKIALSSRIIFQLRFPFNFLHTP